LIAIVQIRHPTAGWAYYHRKRVEDMSSKQRCAVSLAEYRPV
jgi:hypothetical protein